VNVRAVRACERAAAVAYHGTTPFSVPAGEVDSRTFRSSYVRVIGRRDVVGATSAHVDRCLVLS
jgi:hypothetical protein